MKIATGLKTHIDSQILNSVIGQMSDGIWENSRRMENIWRGLDIVKENDELFIDVDMSSQLFFHDEQYVKNYFADKIKQIVKIEQNDGNRNINWNRNCEEPLCYLGYGEVTVKDGYRVYDKLKGRISRIPG